MVQNVIIMGAAGRDFHNFISCFKDRPDYRVIGFTAAQIPRIAGRLFPAELAGNLYPGGIPIFPEEQLPGLIRQHRVDLVVFSYSDLAYAEVMHRAAIVGAAGANFMLLGPQRTMISSRLPVIAVCGVRTGCGKSPTTRKVCEILARNNLKAVVVRHPMPYGDLKEEAVQRFGSTEDFKSCHCTIEELEEFEPLVDQGIVVYAGVDYCRILQAAETEAEVIVWDGGNNDTPFYRPDLHIVLFDPLRPGHELLYYPGETNMRLADIAIINKVDSARPQDVARVRENIERYAPAAAIVLADSRLLVKEPERITGRRVLVVEDGPTITHGGMASGAGLLAAKENGAAELVDPRPYAIGSIAETFRKYPHIGPVLPAMGYGEEQIRELEKTINTARCDLVLFATPIHLARLLDIAHPSLRIRYEYRNHGEPILEEVLVKRLRDIATPKTCRRDAACKEPRE
jgi:predicted GTPase